MGVNFDKLPRRDWSPILIVNSVRRPVHILPHELRVARTYKTRPLRQVARKGSIYARSDPGIRERKLTVGKGPIQ